MKQTIEELRRLQSQPLEKKIIMTRQRIREWVEHYGENGVYVSFSGGKDSTVLLDIVRKDYPNIPAVFVDTGLEYPEIREFVKGYDNVVWLKPKMNFRQVIEKYGYPFISKEVSECVYGARKYLTSILNNESCLTDRQTDRQTDVPLRILLQTDYGSRRIQENETTKRRFRSADNKALNDGTRGGFDNKWRKLRGIGEYAKRQDGKSQRGEQFKTCTTNGNVLKECGTSDKGEYP